VNGETLLAQGHWPSGTVVLVSFGLFIIGLIGLLSQRQVIRQLFGIKIMLQGVSLGLINAGVANHDIARAQSMVISALIVEAVVMAVALALVVNVYRHYPSGNVDDLDRLRG
jgi:NADH-quinone oxidoreductase subunit K